MSLTFPAPFLVPPSRNTARQMPREEQPRCRRCTRWGQCTTNASLDATNVVSQKERKSRAKSVSCTLTRGLSALQFQLLKMLSLNAVCPAPQLILPHQSAHFSISSPHTRHPAIWSNLANGLQACNAALVSVPRPVWIRAMRQRPPWSTNPSVASSCLVRSFRGQPHDR
jgi:hypothetical protein